MNVKIIASHPGLDVGPDGASAQCLERFSLLSLDTQFRCNITM